jgi:hypothetical protein
VHKITEDLPNGRPALELPGRNLHAQAAKPAPSIEVEVGGDVDAMTIEIRSRRWPDHPRHPGRKSTAANDAVAEIGSPNWRTYDVWRHLGRGQEMPIIIGFALLNCRT